MIPIIFSLIAGAALNFVFTPTAIWLCHKYGHLDRPGHRKIHDSPVPQLGGAAFVVAVLLSLAAYFLLFVPFGEPHGDSLALLFILGVTLSLAFIGFLDDRYNLKPSLKLLCQFFVTGCFVFFGYRFELLQIPGFSPIGLSYLALPITALWMMAVINGFNFMDGIDGLSGSVSTIIFLGLGYVSITNGDSALQALSFAALGASLVFLYFNWRPSKIYLGNCGSNALGGLTAAFLMSCHKDAALFTHGNQSLTAQTFPFQLFVSTFLVGYPFLEALLSTIRRGVKRLLLSRSMEWSEKEHIHHRLMKMGFKAPAVCLTGLTLQLFFTSAALLVMAEQKAQAVWILVPVLMVLAYAMPRMGFFDFLDIRIIRNNQPHYIIVHHFISMQRAKLKLAMDREEILALLNQTCAELGVQGFRIILKAEGEGKKSFRYSWERSHDVAQEYINYIKTEIVSGKFEHFKDRIVLEGKRGEANWIFEAHTEEGELDVEYRVLVSDFMREVLGRICSLKGTDSGTDQKVEISQLSHAKVRSSLLRRKHARKK